MITLPTSSIIGILGGGQLGRMLAVAAAQIGMRTHIYCPEAASPAAAVAFAHTQGAYDDLAALERFANEVDVVTTEFENVPATALHTLAQSVPVFPDPAAVEIAQDRLREKDFLRRAGVATAPYATIPDLASLRNAAKDLGLPAILKTRRLGYDGKGQVRVTSEEQLAEAFAALSGVPAIYEGFVDFTREISVVATRGQDGSFTAYDPGENLHEAGILRETRVPAQSAPEVQEDAKAMTRQVMEALDYVGVLGLELFEIEGCLVANEMAPRVHNTGHWTLDGCATSQFEQHIRAICGWRLGSPARHSDVVMTNLLGDDVHGWEGRALDGPGAVHIYGKGTAKPGRKMGHITRLYPSNEDS